MSESPSDSGCTDSTAIEVRTSLASWSATLGNLDATSWMAVATVVFLVLGCGLRIVRYAQNLPLWADECFLAVNFIERGYLQLLEPLDNGQIAPLLYLWIERLVLDLAGFSEATLRLFPLLCGLASMVLFWRLARCAFPDQPRLGASGCRDPRGQRASDSPCRRGEALCVRSPGRPLAAGSRPEMAETAAAGPMALGALCCDAAGTCSIESRRLCRRRGRPGAPAQDRANRSPRSPGSPTGAFASLCC